MLVETPKWTVPEHVKALTTTRLGGVSGAPFDSLNLGDHVQDNPDDVAQNRRRLISELALPNEPIWLSQVHGTLVHKVGEVHKVGDELSLGQTEQRLIGDGATTSQASIVCAVLTADCLPLFLSDRKGHRVAAVHVGWRGLADGIIEVAVSAFDAVPSDIVAWAGPCISAEHFEIGTEVRSALGGSDAAYRESANQGKLLANLYKLAGERLAALGVTDYGHSSACTFADSEAFFSYRRDGQCGRMASLIWMQAKDQ